ncbi:MAG: FAD/FMN-containing dehydrogenase [Myxococcota bacterium]|jgi:FAD/FMN-containing dehydrogenase
MPGRTVEEILAALTELESAETVDAAAVEALLAELRSVEGGGLESVLEDAEADEEELEEGLEALYPNRWQNWPRNLKARPVEFRRPTSRAELIAAVQEAIDAGGKLKPLGASYSCSEASQPVDGGFAIDTQSHLNQTRPVNHVKAGVDTSRLARVQAGMRLIDLAEELATSGLALANLGGFAKQTIAGVMSTGTHGTGLQQSTFADMVVSADIVIVDDAGQAALHRFEPTGGITDPASFPNAAERLHQNDDAFYAMIVACGAMGVVYSYTIRVVDLYWVRETASAFVFPDDFDGVLARAKAGENLSITVFPYATLPGGKFRGVVNHFKRLTRAEAMAMDPALVRDPPTRSDDQAVLGAMAKVFGTDVIGGIMATLPKVFLTQVEKFLENSVGNDFTSVYYKTYPRTTGDRFRAVFNESSVPVGELKSTTRKALRHAAAKESDYRYLVPFSLRFIGGSRHFISMHYGRDSGSLEAFVVKGVPKADEALRDLETALPTARPHWGQLHWFVVPAPAHYPTSWNKWLTQYRKRNATGLFNCATTDLLNIST